MSLYYSHAGIDIHLGDAVACLRELPDESVNCCVTSPPYWGLRDYGTGQWEGGDPDCNHRVGGQVQDGKAPGAITTGQRPGVDSSRCKDCGATRIDQQLGLEKTPEEYIAKMVEVFREVRRVLRNDGTCWVNMGDSYCAQPGQRKQGVERNDVAGWKQKTNVGCLTIGSRSAEGYKAKDLVGIPWTLAKALRDPYYTGHIKVERDRVWLAAIIDGEGTICGFRHERKDDGRIRTGINISITNTCELMLDEAQRIWPGSRHRHMDANHLGDREVFRWIPFKCDANSELLRELYPYLITKKQQALVAWNLLEFVKDGRKLGKSEQAEEVREKRDRLVAILSDLNHGRPAKLPDWIKEPPSLLEPGWWLRQDIIWAKPNPMPESVTDRCTKSHEYIFLLTKSAKYYFDNEAIKEPAANSGQVVSLGKRSFSKRQADGAGIKPSGNGNASEYTVKEFRNKRDVWTVATAPCKDAHFAVFPPKLIEPDRKSTR